MMTPQAQINQHQWVQLSAETRNKLAGIFGIPRSEASAIMGNTLVSDGHNNSDLAVVTKEKMEVYLGIVVGSKLDFYELFKMVVELVEKKKVLTDEERIKTIETENIGKWLIILNDMKQKAKELNLEEQFSRIVNEIFTVQKETRQGTKKRSI